MEQDAHCLDVLVGEQFVEVVDLNLKLFLKVLRVWAGICSVGMS